jgi:hypothetical protein
MLSIVRLSVVASFVVDLALASGGEQILDGFLQEND